MAFKKLHAVFNRRPKWDVGSFQCNQALLLDYRLHFALINEDTTLSRTDNQLGRIFDFVAIVAPFMK